MNWNIFESTISALCYSVVSQKCSCTGEDFALSPNEAVRFVIHQYQLMPDFLRLPIWLLTLIFNLSTLFSFGKLFHTLPTSSRWQKVEAWRNSPLSFCRDLIRFYEGLTIFYCYSEAVHLDS